jgi:putative glutamine amidotransferase
VTASYFPAALTCTPGYFGKAEDSARCSIDPYRDTLEMSLIGAALEREMPILAICRGMQILNVALGGTLIIDIPEDHPNPEIHQIDDGDAMHMVRLNKNSLLFKLAKIDSAEVNSNHHQAVDILADKLTASAVSRDGIVEAFEYTDYENLPFMIGVQWHPERLGHPDMSDAIGKIFLEKAEEFRKIRD